MYKKDDSFLVFLSSMYEMLPSVYLTMRPSCPVETRNVGQLEYENNNLDQPIYEKIVTTVEISLLLRVGGWVACLKLEIRLTSALV